MPVRLFTNGLPPQRIRTFLILFALVLTLPLLGLGIFGLNRMAGLEQAETERRVMEVAQDLAEAVDGELERASVILETLATSASLERGDFSTFHSRAMLALKGTKANIALLDRSYRQIISTQKEFGAQLTPTADLETAKRVFEMKQRQVSNLFRRSASERPVFDVQVPVLSGDVVAYVLVVTFPVSHIADLLRTARLDRPWITGVTDNNGIILARSERHEDFVGQPLPAELLAQSRTAKTVFRGTNVVGEPILRASVRSEIAGWLVSATVPVSYADAPRRRSEVFALGMIGVALALGAALAFLFGAFMARPLTAAAAAAEAVGRGEQMAPLRSPLVEANILTAALSEASSELKRGREYSDFLMRELAHRAKNQLAVVRGMALQTAKQSRSIDEFATQFTQRIQGFAESQDLLLRQNWQGAWMGDLVRAHLDLYAAGKRAQASGPPIFLSAKAVQNIGFALHELATNASKHGALSKPGGRVVIGWSRPGDGDRIRLEWVEQNGPSVTAPLRQGFGHLVLTQLVPAALQGTSTLEFCSDGVHWQLEIPTSDAVSAPGTTVETSDANLS